MIRREEKVGLQLPSLTKHNHEVADSQDKLELKDGMVSDLQTEKGVTFFVVSFIYSSSRI